MRGVSHVLGRGEYTVLGGGEAEVKRTLGRPCLRWEDIKMDFQEMG